MTPETWGNNVGVGVGGGKATSSAARERAAHSLRTTSLARVVNFFGFAIGVFNCLQLAVVVAVELHWSYISASRVSFNYWSGV